MQRVWFVYNAASGSASRHMEAVVAALEAHAHVVGRTDFPGGSLPTIDALRQAGANMIVVLAGDGTINAVACRYAAWDGALLVLAGGTMNLLARTLHGDDAPATVVERALAAPMRLRALPIVQAGDHCAFVGLILGPATSLNRVREALRAGNAARAWRALRHAWLRIRRRRIRFHELPGYAQAVFVRPDGGTMTVAAVEARDWRMVGELGWDWITGDWIGARAVTQVKRDRLTLAGRRPARALFDGEATLLPPGTVIGLGRSRTMFVATGPEDE